MTTPTLTSIAVAPTTVVLSMGEKQTLTVTGTFDDGSHSTLTDGLTWDSSAPGVVMVSDKGIATAVAGGSAKITAHSGAKTAQVDLAVILRVFGDDYGAGLGYAPFGGSLNNPGLDQSDKYAGTTSLKIEVPSTGYTGGSFRTSTAVDLSSFNAITFWARASKAATLNVVGFGNDSNQRVRSCEWNAVPLTTTWTHYVMPIPAPGKLTAEQGLFHEAEGSDEGPYTIWLDAIQYEVVSGGIGAPSPVISTETATIKIDATAPVNGSAVIYPVGGADEKIVVMERPYFFAFHSSDEAIATVDASGIVTGHAAGTATITAKMGTVDAAGALTVQVTP
jgi:hypothetical protein